MAYRWIDHTAELELHLDCPTEEAVFADALLAFAELIGDGGEREPVEEVDVDVDESDRPALLARWIDELVFRAETADLVPDTIAELRLGEDGLQARVRAHRGSPRHVVKGVTYHGLRFERAGERFHATLVLDV